MPAQQTGTCDSSRRRPFSPVINRDTAGDFRFINSDMSFRGNYVIQGNFNGVQIWDISNIKIPSCTRRSSGPGSQSDVSVYRNFLFVSGEALNGRTDCAPRASPIPSAMTGCAGPHLRWNRS